MKRCDLTGEPDRAPLVTGVAPLLSLKDRNAIRKVEMTRRRYNKAIALLTDLRRGLPTRKQMAAKHNCSVTTIKAAARGRVYARDRLAKVPRETSPNNLEIFP